MTLARRSLVCGSALAAVPGQAAALDGLPAEPWKRCHCGSCMGDPWRASVVDELGRLVDGAAAGGGVGRLEVSDSNGDVPQQIARMRAFIDKGRSVVTTIAGPSTALNDVIEAAYKAGSPVVEHENDGGYRAFAEHPEVSIPARSAGTGARTSRRTSSSGPWPPTRRRSTPSGPRAARHAFRAAVRLPEGQQPIAARCWCRSRKYGRRISGGGPRPA